MSTNYYCRNKKEYRDWLKKEDWLDGIIKNAISQLEVLALSEWVINSIVNKIKYEYTEQADYHAYEEFHIGKYSGRKFKLEVQHHYKASLNSLFEWLYDNRSEYEIINEYGNIISIEELKEIILSCELGEKWLNYNFS